MEVLKKRKHNSEKGNETKKIKESASATIFSSAKVFLIQIKIDQNQNEHSSNIIEEYHC